MALFEHKQVPKRLYLYIEKNGVNTPIKFYNVESPYSRQPTHGGGFNPVEIDRRVIITAASIESATAMNSLTDFIIWVNEAKEELESFLAAKNISLSDIKVLKVTTPQPEEEELTIDLSVLF